jgi:hypothetical protein
MIEEEGKREHLTEHLMLQIKLNQELAIIIQECPTCRALSKPVVQNYMINKRSLSDPLGKVCQTVVNLDNDAEVDVSSEVDVVNGYRAS